MSSKYGTKELKQEVLPKVAKGEYFIGISTTEPAGGSDVANIRTTAVLKGDDFILKGEKIYISGSLFYKDVKVPKANVIGEEAVPYR